MNQAKDIMTREVITVTPDKPVSEVAQILMDQRISGVPVVNADGDLMGIVCESDIIDQTKKLHIPTVVNLMGYIIFLESGKKFEKEMKKMIGLTAGDIMTSPVKSVTPETSIEEIATLMSEGHIHSIPVIEGSSLVGIVGKKDIVNSLAR
ncbi:MAG TPA: CBS domain-containing protein [Thermodesulfobacteriota bacterium]|nr:CBS domain-containing protein [Thermodesulfobacteriota bacterium]